MPGGGDYTMIHVGEGTGGGMMTSQSPRHITSVVGLCRRG
jgi:hypothetical protein